MASQGSSIDTSIGNLGVSPTSRLVTGILVLDTIIPSSIAPHAIPGASTSAGKYALQSGYVLGFLQVVLLVHVHIISAPLRSCLRLCGGDAGKFSDYSCSRFG